MQERLKELCFLLGEGTLHKDNNDFDDNDDGGGDDETVATL